MITILFFPYFHHQAKRRSLLELAKHFSNLAFPTCILRPRTQTLYILCEIAFGYPFKNSSLFENVCHIYFNLTKYNKFHVDLNFLKEFFFHES